MRSSTRGAGAARLSETARTTARSWRRTTRPKCSGRTLKALRENRSWQPALIADARKLLLPKNALDDIIDQLGGTDAVAEMTGRGERQVRHWKPDPVTGVRPMVTQKRCKDENGVSLDEQNIYEREEFLSDQKKVAIISDAASSGISLHAEKNAARCKNAHRQRVHITLELPWSADRTIQQMGRSHRSNQASAPRYELLVSPLGGEKRFASSVVKKLASLGALTQGDRRATGIAKGWGCFNLDTKHGREALIDIYHHAAQRSLEVAGVQPLSANRPIVAPPRLSEFEARSIVGSSRRTRASSASTSTTTTTCSTA